MSEKIKVDILDAAAIGAAILKLLPTYDGVAYNTAITKMVEDTEIPEDLDLMDQLAYLPCPCDPTGTGCHHADCPIGRAEAAEHLLVNAQARIDLFIEHIQKETERARQLETANPIATKDVLERLLKKWKEMK